MSRGRLSFKDLLNPVASAPSHTVLSHIHASNDDELEAEVMASLPRLLEANNAFAQDNNIAAMATGSSPNSVFSPMATPAHVTSPPSDTHLPPIKSVLSGTVRPSSGEDIPRYATINSGTDTLMDGGARNQVGRGEAITHQQKPLRTETYGAGGNRGGHMLTQFAAPSRPAYYPSQPFSYHYAPAVPVQSSQRVTYPSSLGPTTMGVYGGDQGPGYGPRAIASLPSKSPPLGMDLSRVGHNVGATLGSGYQRPRYDQQTRQAQHVPPAPSPQQLSGRQQNLQYPSFAQISQAPQQYPHYYEQRLSVAGECHQHHHVQESTLNPSAARSYYGHPPSGPHHHYPYVQVQGSGIGNGVGHNGNKTQNQQIHSLLPRAITESSPSRSGSPYIVPSGPLPDSSSMLRSCANCGTRETPSWRRCGAEQTILCNACGLYYNEHKRHRQFRVNADGRTRAVRSPKIRLIEGDRCPECTVRGGETTSVGTGSCGTCQYIKQQQNPSSNDPPIPSLASQLGGGDGNSSSESLATAPAPSSMTIPTSLHGHSHRG